MESIYFFWIAIIFISIIAEAITSQLVSVWFMVGGLFALITSFFTQSLLIQTIIFIMVSVSMLVLLRPFLKNILNFKIEETNFARIIGKNALVTRNIDNTSGVGEVFIEGMSWSARSADNSKIDKGAIVKIDSISGVKLIVHKVRDQSLER